MKRGDLLADGVLASVTLLARFYPGFTDSNHTAQAPGLPNHFAWCLGHLALTMHRVAGMIDGRALPEDTFVHGAVGDVRRFGVESVAFGSNPADTPSNYPGRDRCVEIVHNAADRLAAALRSADDASLDTPHPWGKVSTTGAALAQRMIFHNGVHCGQITDLRRALKLGNVLV